MRRIYIIFIVLVLLILSAITVYNNFVNTVQDRVDIRGEVKNVMTYGDVSTILVEGKLESDTHYDKASIRIDQHTRITRGFTSEVVDISQIQVGDKVEVTFKGPVGLSYPVQALAEAINIIEEGD